MTGSAAVHAASGIDLTAGLERVMGDVAMFVRVLARFAADYRDLATRLHAALDAGDTILAQRIAHTLKGAAGMIEAGHLRRLALEVELVLKSGAAAPTALVDALDAELAQVLVEVDALLAAQAAPTLPAPAAPAIDPRDLARLRDMLDIGDGRAPELVALLRPRLFAALGSARMAALEAAVGRFDFEQALLLLEQSGDVPAPDINA